MTQARGCVTQRVKDKSKELLGYEVDTTELRLMARRGRVRLGKAVRERPGLD